MLRFPDVPAVSDVPADRRATAQVQLRYEDVAQDGRLALEALSPTLGEVVWSKLLWPSPHLKTLGQQGIVPILTRLVIEGQGGPFATHRPIEASGTFRLAHAVDAAGEVQRILVEMWAEARLPIGKNFPPRPSNAGEVVPAGRIFGEHVLTRLFAPPDQRRVTRLEVPGLPAHPGERVAVVPAEALLALPDGATPLDDAPRADPLILAFGLSHTDSNQHVNSLVYPRIFEDACLRRFAALGRLKPPVLSRFVEATFRKPCFAGERYAIVLQAFALGDALGAVGAFVAAEESRKPLAEARPHCLVRMLFER